MRLAFALPDVIRSLGYSPEALFAISRSTVSWEHLLAARRVFLSAGRAKTYRDRVARTEPLLEPLANPVTFSVSLNADVALTEPHLGKMMTWSGQV